MNVRQLLNLSSGCVEMVNSVVITIKKCGTKVLFIKLTESRVGLFKDKRDEECCSAQSSKEISLFVEPKETNQRNG